MRFSKKKIIVQAIITSIIGALDFASTRPGGAIEALQMPTPPDWELLKDNCKKEEEGWTSCTSKTTRTALFGKPADTNGRTRHIAYTLLKRDFKGPDIEIKTEMLVQSIFDCKTSKSYSKFVATRIDLGLGKGWRSSTPQSEWKEINTDNLDTNDMLKFCPTRAGYQRIGVVQLDTKNVITNGSVTNIRGISENGNEEYVLSIDCKGLLYGIDERPRKPIAQGTAVAEMHKRFCRAKNK